MKRPLAVIGITYAAVQIFAVILGAAASAVLCFITFLSAVLTAILCSKEHRRTVLPVLVSCMAAFGAYAVCWYAEFRPAQLLCGQEVYIHGRLAFEPEQYDDRVYYVIDTDHVSVSSAPQNVRMRIYSDKSLDAVVGDEISASVNISRYDESEPFSVASSRLSRGIMVSGFFTYGYEPEITDVRQGIKYRIYLLRSSIKDRVADLLDDDLAALLNGVMLGDKSGLSDQVTAQFRACGISHILAVSGLHMSIIVYFVTALLKNIGVPYRLVSFASLCMVWFYMALTGFSYSVLRAGLMTSIMLLGRIVRREADALNSLGAALLMICLFNPFAAADAGLMLSASATAGLIIFSRPVNKRATRIADGLGSWNRKIVHMLISSVTTSIIASVCTLPIIALYFGEYSFIAPVANLLCVRLSTVFIGSGAAAAGLSYIPVVGRFLSVFVISITWLSGSLIMLITGLLSSIPYASVTSNFVCVRYLIPVAIIVFSVWFILFGRKNGKTCSFLACCAVVMELVLVGISAEMLFSSEIHTITVYDVGRGMSVVARSGKSCVVIGTGGNRYDVRNMAYELQDSDLSYADAVFFPGMGCEYTSYLEEFTEINKPRRIFLPPVSETSDEVAYYLLGYEGGLYNIYDAYFETDNGRLSVETYVDDNGLVWVYIDNSGVTVLVCPDGGDCRDIPQSMYSPDCAVVMTDSLINIDGLSAGSFVISSTEGSAASAVTQLRLSGAQNVYDTGFNDVIISKFGSGVRIEEG